MRCQIQCNLKFELLLQVLHSQKIFWMNIISPFSNFSSFLFLVRLLSANADLFPDNVGPYLIAIRLRRLFSSPLYLILKNRSFLSGARGHPQKGGGMDSCYNECLEVSQS